MDLQMESVFDIGKARGKRRVWQAHKRPCDMFAGTSNWEKAELDGVSVLRLSVLPEPASSIPNSFSIVSEPDWQPVATPSLPHAFTWQQSLPGRFDFYFDLAPSLKCLALGERFSGLNVRGERHTLVSTDNPDHNETMDSMYKPVPFLLVGTGDDFSAIFIDSAAPSRFDLDSEMTGEGHIELFTRRGFRVYLLGPGSVKEMVATFTALAGRGKLPPLWSLGHQQCRWSYPDESTVRELAAEFRKRRIPCDTLVLDIDYMDEYRVFTASPERFPHFNQMLLDLASDNFNLVTIVDPGVKQDPEYEVFAEGKERGLFCQTPDGDLFVEKVWPGPSAFPDFLQAETRQWWAGKHKFLTDRGVKGIWNDMNEPAFFGVTRVLPEQLEEMPDAETQLCIHQTEDGPVSHLEVRNLYGFLMCRSTYDGLIKERPNERPFVLTRSGTAGIQRYAAVWLGDNKSWYHHLEKSVPMLLNVGLSGMPFAGVDIGGFWQDALPELVVRWYELGIFYPFFRNHCALNYRGQEPFSYAPVVEDMVRNLIETRYRLLPYIRNLFWEHLRTGAPLMRPLLWHYSKDPIAADIDDQFMFGEDILVAPVLNRAHEYRCVYFPEGDWYQLQTNERFKGGRTATVKMPLGSVPAFVRSGAILPLADVMQHTGEYASSGITFLVFGDEAACRHFEDDGISFDYERGAYNEHLLSFSRGKLEKKTVHRGFDRKQNFRYQTAGSDAVKPFEL